MLSSLLSTKTLTAVETDPLLFAPDVGSKTVELGTTRFLHSSPSRRSEIARGGFFLVQNANFLIFLDSI